MGCFSAMSRSAAAVQCRSHARSACKRVQGPAPFTKKPVGAERGAGASAMGRARPCFIDAGSRAEHRDSSSRCHAKYPTLVTQALRAKNASSFKSTSLPLRKATEHRTSKDKNRLTRMQMQMQIQGSAVPLRSPAVPRGIRLALVEPCQQPANPSIERTRPGKPGRASHVKR